MHKLILENLIIGRNTDSLLSGLSISKKFEFGKCYYIQGKNGSGKTTLMRTICQYFPPLSGKIDISPVFPYRTAYFGHHNSLKQRMTVESYLRHAQKIFPDTDDLDYLITLFQIHKFMSIPIHYLSCGQQKRVALVAFFICNRDIYCLDEAASGLDQEFRDIYYKYIIEITKKQQNLILFSDHINPKLQNQDEFCLDNMMIT